MPTATRSPRTPRPASTPRQAAPAKKAAAPVKAVRKAVTKPVAAPAPAAPTVDAVPTKVKHKLVRDSFTIPKTEYAVLDGLKSRAADLKRPTKKSEVLRAGIAALAAMDNKAFLQALNAVDSLKTGRPKADTGTKGR